MYRIDAEAEFRAHHALALIAHGVSPEQALQLVKEMPLTTQVPSHIPRPYKHWIGVVPLPDEELDRADAILRPDPRDREETRLLARQLVNLSPMRWELAVNTVRTIQNQRALVNLTIANILTRAGVSPTQYPCLWFPGVVDA